MSPEADPERSPGNTLDEAVALAGVLHDRLALDVGRPPGPDADRWFAVADLVDPSTGVLAGLIGDHARHRRIDDDAVAASLWFQRYCHRLAGAAVAPWVLSGAAPILDPADARVRVTDASPDRLAVGTVRGLGARHDPDALLEALVDRHAAPLIAAVRDLTRIGRANLWGNLTAAIAGAFGMLSAVGEPAERMHALGASVIGRRATLRAGGHFVVVRNGSASRLCFSRATCCRWHEIPDGDRCSWCSLRDPDDRIARFRAALDVT